MQYKQTALLQRDSVGEQGVFGGDPLLTWTESSSGGRKGGGQERHPSPLVEHLNVIIWAGSPARKKRLGAERFETFFYLPLLTKKRRECS